MFAAGCVGAAGGGGGGGGRTSDVEVDDGIRGTGGGGRTGGVDDEDDEFCIADMLGIFFIGGRIVVEGPADAFVGAGLKVGIKGGRAVGGRAPGIGAPTGFLTGESTGSGLLTAVPGVDVLGARCTTAGLGFTGLGTPAETGFPGGKDAGLGMGVDVGLIGADGRGDLGIVAVLTDSLIPGVKIGC
jgi:hypothetical protein